MKDIIDFIGDRAYYHVDSGSVLGVNWKEEVQLIADIRGWGAIQQLFKNTPSSLRSAKQEAFQDRLGEFIADAISEKIERELNDTQESS
jgi:hypothetical protein